MESQNERNSTLQCVPMPGPSLVVLDDVLANIFYIFVAILGENLGEQKPPLALSPSWFSILGSVSKQWRTVALSTPRLWTDIHIDIGHPSQFANAVTVLRRFEDRSGACPLKINVTFSNVEEALPVTNDDMKNCQSLANELAASVGRWKHFNTNCHPSFLLKIEQTVLQSAQPTLPLLERLEIRPYSHSEETWPNLSQQDFTGPLIMFTACPKLRHVSLGIGHSFHGGEDVPIQLQWLQIENLERIEASFKGCMQIFQYCPNLVRFNIDVARDYGVHGPVHALRHHLQSLEICFDDEYGTSFDALFGSLDLPLLLELRITFNDKWQPLTQARLTQFLSATLSLQRLILGLYNISPEDFHCIIKALPRGLLELEFIHQMEDSEAPTIYSKQLLDDITLRTPDYSPSAWLPQLRVLSLVGKLDVNIRAFTAMIRSRTWDNAGAHRGAELQSLQMYILESPKSLTIEDLQILKDCLKHRARFRVVHRGRGGRGGHARSLAFPELL